MARERTYRLSESAHFRFTRAKWGEFSNFHPDFPLVVNDIDFATSEQLYQAMKFTEHPDTQLTLARETSPKVSKAFAKICEADQMRADWQEVKVDVMRWVIRVKLAQHWTMFGSILVKTRNMPIVEFSRRDAFWGAIPESNEKLVGVNALGRLLMELRQELLETDADRLKIVPSLKIPDATLNGITIEEIWNE